MASSTLWWLIAAAAVVLELLSGTVYLLLLGVGFAAAALAAHVGAGFTLQLMTAAVVGVGAMLAWYLVRRSRPAEPPAQANRDVNLDIGETVQVGAWNADGTASVHYRGAQWTVVPRPGAALSTGTHRIVEVSGNRLVVDKI
jgi:membrane protein implicated in regulation of membrane protease activity